MYKFKYNQGEPALEDYGLDPKSYLEHRKYINSLIRYRKSLSLKFWQYIFYIPTPIFIISFFLFDVQIGLSILMSLISLLFFDFIKNYSDSVNQGYLDTGEKILSYSSKTKVKNFEDDLIKYLHEKINDFYKNYFYKKRNHPNPRYFVSMIKEYDNFRSFMSGQEMVKNLYLSFYNEYITNRFPYLRGDIYDYSKFIKFNCFDFSKIINPYFVDSDVLSSILKDIKESENLNNIESLDSKLFNEVDRPRLDSKYTERKNKTEKIKELMDIIETIPPEKKYAQPRKIDWESVNKTRQITGMKGEEIALEMEKEYLISINRSDLSEKVKHVSKEVGDGLGYDILSFFPDEQEKYIEVKSTGKSNTNSFNISSNELNFMKDNINNTYIYKIFNVNENDEVPTLEIITAETVLNSDQIIPTQYLVRM